MVTAIANGPFDYVCHGYEKVWTVVKKKASAEASLRAIKDTWLEIGASIFDGWKD